VPFKAADQMIDELARHLQRMQADAQAMLPEDIAALARLFPVLGRVPEILEATRLRPLEIYNVSEVRRRAFVAFAELVRLLSGRHRLIICLDDLQWGDVDSAALFQHLYAQLTIPAFTLILISRSEPVGFGFYTAHQRVRLQRGRAGCHANGDLGSS
jgi:predicted ATPase